MTGSCIDDGSGPRNSQEDPTLPKTLPWENERRDPAYENYHAAIDDGDGIFPDENGLLPNWYYEATKDLKEAANAGPLVEQHEPHGRAAEPEENRPAEDAETRSHDRGDGIKLDFVSFFPGADGLNHHFERDAKEESSKLSRNALPSNATIGKNEEKTAHKAAVDGEAKKHDKTRGRARPVFGGGLLFPILRSSAGGSKRVRDNASKDRPANVDTDINVHAETGFDMANYRIRKVSFTRTGGNDAAQPLSGLMRVPAGRSSVYSEKWSGVEGWLDEIYPHDSASQISPRPASPEFDPDALIFGWGGDEAK